MNSIRQYPGAFFLLFFLMELTAITFGVGRFDIYFNPILWLVGSIGASITGYGIFIQRDEPVVAQMSSLPRWISLALLVIGLGVAGSMIYKATGRIPIDSHVSDIVPSLKIYLSRFLSGEKVYAPIPFDTWTVKGAYLPLFWLPYVPAELLHIDYRFFSFIILGIAILVLFAPMKNRDSMINFKILLVLLCPFLIIHKHSEVYMHSVEFTIAAFYLLLATSLVRNSGAAISFALLFCLLSRYSFTFWLPVFLLIVWIQNGFYRFLPMVLVLALGSLLIFGPFLLKDPEILANGKSYYLLTIETLWHPHYWQQATEIPFHINRGVSTSIFFYNLLPGDVAVRLNTAKFTHMALVILSAFGILLFFLRFRSHQWFHFGGFAICSLNFYLAIFYGFLYVPFSYLFIIPLFAKLPILIMMRREHVFATSRDRQLL